MVDQFKGNGASQLEGQGNPLESQSTPNPVPDKAFPEKTHYPIKQVPAQPPMSRSVGLGPAGIVVIKVPKGAPSPNQQAVQTIMRITGCSVIVLPSFWELVEPEYSMKEIEAIHKLIHRVLKDQAEQAS